MLRDDQDKAPLIFPWHKLSSFGRLILIKVLRLESLNSAVREFIIEKLGSRYIWTGGIDLKSVYEESDSTTPLILIHTHGVDIAAVLLRLAQEIKGNTQHVKMMSLGRGQGSKAEELVYKSQIQKGQWAFLQNCHLAASFMPRLCTIVDSLDQAHTDIDPEFRLWLSSTPDNSIPVSILRKSLKISIHILEMLLEKQSKIPWAALHYLTGEVVYGGRVTDHWDRRCLLSILDNFYNPSVLQEDFAYSVDWFHIEEKSGWHPARVRCLIWLLLKEQYNTTFMQ